MLGGRLWPRPDGEAGIEAPNRLPFAPLVARQQRQQTSTSGRRRRGLTDRGRPRKYTRLNVEQIDYKDLGLLRRFISDRGKTRSRRVTGLSRKHQQQLALAVKRARELALLPYVGER
jgi:small subunit ribosomal protein S18